MPGFKETRLAKWLGIKYLTGSDTGRLHSSTAFVQFKTLAAKQQAIQCNITGANNLLLVTPVPEIRDIKWENMHVSRALIETRKNWANLVLVGGLILWSLIVSAIRSLKNLSESIPIALAQEPAIAAFIDTYMPAMVVEGIVRGIPYIINFISVWIRYKSGSECDHYLLNWYFGFRLLTFIFVIIGGSLADSSDDFIRDPMYVNAAAR